MTTFIFSNRIFGLDFMRCTAILLVVVGHFAWLLPDTFATAQSYMHMMAFLGVEVFFVLSGFLIGSILWRTIQNSDFKRADIGYFWIRRWFRTLPNYYLILLVNVLLVGILQPSAIPDKAYGYLFFFQNLYATIPNFFTESWSLTVEEYAYLIGPILLLLLGIVFKMKTRLFLAIVIGIILAGFLLKLNFHNEHPQLDYQLWNLELKLVALYRIDAIYYGVLGAYFMNMYGKLFKKYRAFLLVFGLIVLVGVMFPLAGHLSIDQTPVFWNVFYLPLISVAVLFTLPFFSNWKQNHHTLFNKLVTHTSLVSYGMYLLHYSITLFLIKRYLGVLSEQRLVIIGVFVGYLGLVYAAASFLYRFYEKPVMDLRDHPRVKRMFRNT